MYVNTILTYIVNLFTNFVNIKTPPHHRCAAAFANGNLLVQDGIGLVFVEVALDDEARAALGFGVDFADILPDHP